MTIPLTGWPDLKVEIAPGYTPLTVSPTWVDVTDKVAWRLTSQRGRFGSSDRNSPGTLSVVFDDPDRVLDGSNTSSPYYQTYLNLTGVATSYAYTVDHASLDITGDIDLRCRVALTDWTSGGNQFLMSRWTGVNDLGWYFFVNTTGGLELVWTTSGAIGTAAGSASTANPSVSDGSALWVRATLDVNNGAGGKVVTFYTSTDDTNDHTTVSWTQLGSAVTTAGTTSIAAVNSVLAVGAIPGAGSTGKGYAAAVLNGIGGTVVANPNFTLGIGAGGTTFTDGAGRPWIVNSGASAVGVGTYIRPRLPVRFRSTYSAVDYPICRTHLTTPSHSFPPDGDNTSTFDCIDLFAVMASVDTSQRSAWASTIERHQPVAWWRLGDSGPTEGVEATDELGLYDGVYRGTTGTSVDGLIDDDQSPAVNFGTDGWVQIDPYAFDALPTSHTLIMRMQSPLIGADVRSLFSAYLPDAGAGGRRSTLYIYPVTGLAEFLGGSAVSTTLTSTTRVDDSSPHTLAITFTPTDATLYVDGVAEATTSIGPPEGIDGPSGYNAAAGLGRSVGPLTGTVLPINHADNVILDDVVLLPSALTAANHLELHEAAVDSWAGETTGQRIARAAALADIPTGLQDLDTGISTVTAWSGGPSTIDIAQTAAETEQGILVVSADGKLTFEDRHAHLTDSSAATFGDSGADLTYASHDVEQGEHLLINRATFTSPAGTGYAEDATSRGLYGVKAVRRTTIDDTRGNLAAGAQYLVARSKSPEQRIVGLEIDPTYDPATLWPQVLGRDIGDRITVNRTPDTGSSVSQVVTIVGIRHTISNFGWRTYWSLSSADTASFAISDVSLSDGPALAAF